MARRSEGLSVLFDPNSCRCTDDSEGASPKNPTWCACHPRRVGVRVSRGGSCAKEPGPLLAALRERLRTDKEWFSSDGSNVELTAHLPGQYQTRLASQLRRASCSSCGFDPSDASAIAFYSLPIPAATWNIGCRGSREQSQCCKYCVGAGRKQLEQGLAQPSNERVSRCTIQLVQQSLRCTCTLVSLE